jgi:brefeldin A-resistance guanine nucleotide exchange factor 1
MCVWAMFASASQDADAGPDGLPAMVELLRVLINILDPNDKSHTDSIRLVSMRILLNVVAVGGRKLGDFPSLAALVNDHGCKYLFQLARSDNPSVLQLALRLITSIFEVMRDQLKLQQELFIAFTIDRLASPTILPPPAFASRASLLSPRPGTPASTSTGPAAVDSPHPDSPAPSKPAVLPARGETRELLLDMLSQLTNYSSFFVDLYTNYDCDLNCENLFNRLIEFLTQACHCEVAL